VHQREAPAAKTALVQLYTAISATTELMLYWSQTLYHTGPRRYLQNGHKKNRPP